MADDLVELAFSETGKLVRRDTREEVNAMPCQRPQVTIIKNREQLPRDIASISRAFAVKADAYMIGPELLGDNPEERYTPFQLYTFVK